MIGLNIFQTKIKRHIKRKICNKFRDYPSYEIKEWSREMDILYHETIFISLFSASIHPEILLYMISHHLPLF